MRKLEEYVRENRDLFDDMEPDDGHFARFSEKLEAEPGKERFTIRRSSMMRVAAIILLFITVSVFMFDFALNKWRNDSPGRGSALNSELDDALQYYDSRTSDRLVEFRKLACCGEQQVRLNNMVNGELNALDANSAELKKSLSANPENEMIQAALIKNHQMKETVVENMIQQLKGVGSR